MKRTRVDGQLSRLEYEEQEASSAGGGFDSYVSPSVSDGVGCVGYCTRTSGRWPLSHTEHSSTTKNKTRAPAAAAAGAAGTAARRSSGRRLRRWRRGGW